VEATRIAGEDPDYLTRDLWEAMKKAEFAQYELFVQMMDTSEEQNQTFDPLDPTKTWPEDKFPLMPVGNMVLDRNPDNFFVQVEQAAFCPANLVPGIEFSDDKLSRAGPSPKSTPNDTVWVPTSMNCPPTVRFRPWPITSAMEPCSLKCSRGRLTSARAAEADR
jgi:hypothetical protein